MKEYIVRENIADAIEKSIYADKVQELIRCKDCIWHLKDDSCARLYCITDDDFYCWYGRREE